MVGLLNVCLHVTATGVLVVGAIALTIGIVSGIIPTD